MKIKVALLKGGYTGEAEVSFKSADFVYSKIDKDKYDVYPITVSHNSWFYQDDDGVKHEINRHDFSLSLNGIIIKFDVAFIIIHGTPGEDGRIQGYFDLIGLPYTSCNTLTSSLTMNKSYTKSVLVGIPELYLSNSVLLFETDRANATSMIKGKLTLPIFIKPNAGGSSIGMSKVKDWSELQSAINLAYDTENTGAQVLVEEFVTGREFSQGIYRDSKGEIQILPATEVRSSKEFFDYEAKYTSGLTEEITPAALTSEEKDRASRIIREIYLRLNCSGMVRVDFFLEKDTDNFFFIEINTVPGQTAQSFIPQQVRASGRSETDFYGELIEAALIRH